MASRDTGRNGRSAHARESSFHQVGWTPPPPWEMSESRARMALGKRYGLYTRLATMRKHMGEIDGWLRWGHIWKAATSLIAEKHAPRDSHVLERAREYARQEKAYWKEQEQRRAERRRRRTDGQQPTPDQGGPAE